MDRIEHISSMPEFSSSSVELGKIECIEVLVNSKDIVASSITTTSEYTGSKHDLVFIFALLEKCLTEIVNITTVCSHYQETKVISGFGELFRKNVELIKISEPGFTEAFTCLCVLSKWIDNAQEYIINDFEDDDSLIIDSISNRWQEIFFKDCEVDINDSQINIPELTNDQILSEDSNDDDIDFDFEDDFSDFSSDIEFNSDNVIELLANEIKNISGDLEDILLKIVYGEDEELLDAVTEYVTLVECLMEASNSVELNGLSDVCSFIIENITILSSYSKSDRDSVLDLIQPWIKLVQNYLAEPATDEKCLNIVNHLDDDKWPAPLTGVAWRDLFTKLDKDISNTLESGIDEQRQLTANPQDILLNIAEDARPEVVDAFMQEAPQLATDFSTHLGLINKAENIDDNLEAAQRLSHSLKGSANLIGLSGIANLSHNLEDIFELLQKKKIQNLPDKLTNVLQDASDCIESMIDAVMGEDEIPQNALSVFQSVLDWANIIASNENLYQVDDSEIDTNKNIVAVNDLNDEENESTVTVRQAVNTDSIRVSTLTIEEMYRLIGEVSISVGQIQTQVRHLLQQSDHYRQQDNMVQQRRFDLENIIDLRGKDSVHHPFMADANKNSDFDALEMDQYDDLYSTTHRYIEAVADSREISHSMHSELIKLDGLFLQQSRLNKELENVVIATRMVPVSSIESRLFRNVRQVCRATNKQAVLELDGLDLMLDVEVLNKLVNPLMHILRNAVDHGIELPEQRDFLQKNPEGRIVLKFSHDGNHVLVQCNDDGCGLDYDKIRETATDKGLLRADHQADKKELARLILTPGFTTRDTTTQISGRGVGLDVVHNTIKDLKGTLELGDSKQNGLQITIRLPVSLVTSHSLIVSSNNELLALPTAALTQVLAPGTGEFKRLGDSMTFQLGKSIYPVRTIAGLLNQKQTVIDENKTVILIRSDTGIVAVTIDSAVNSHDLVIKSTGSYVGQIQGVLGVSILGDGSIIPVLDVLELLRSPLSKTSTKKLQSSTISTVKSNLLRVLIVDDSLSVRKSLTQLVEDAGFEPIQASDGVEAMNLLEKEQADIALIDMEMPRMNGLELTQHIRGNDAIKDLPIIMITSRAQKKHREHAESVGVNVYVTKPYTEDKLLDEINTLVTL
jgi:chemosensory pili system protein ChpA (sensor histidine kinase/response regulator)